MIEAGSCRALLCKLRSTTLARIAQCAGFLWTKNWETQIQCRNCIGTLNLNHYPAANWMWLNENECQVTIEFSNVAGPTVAAAEIMVCALWKFTAFEGGSRKLVPMAGVWEEDMEIIVPQREAVRRQELQRIQLESSGRYAGTAQMVPEKSAWLGSRANPFPLIAPLLQGGI